MDSRQALPGVALEMGLILVLESIIVVFCLFDNFTMNWLYPFSVIGMAEDGVMVNIIWHKAVVDSFCFARCC